MKTACIENIQIYGIYIFMTLFLLFYRRAFAKWEQNPCIFILGSHTAPRVPIFSFLTLHPLTGKLIHHNFISTLLSDLFGIQARGGCACAGPYAEVSWYTNFFVCLYQLLICSDSWGVFNSTLYICLAIHLCIAPLHWMWNVRSLEYWLFQPFLVCYLNHFFTLDPCNFTV